MEGRFDIYKMRVDDLPEFSRAHAALSRLRSKGENPEELRAIAAFLVRVGGWYTPIYSPVPGNDGSDRAGRICEAYQLAWTDFLEGDD
jgi:hypothetical protein